MSAMHKRGGAMQVGKSIFGTDADVKPTKAAPRAAAPPAPSPTKAAAASKPSAAATSKAEATKPSAATESAKPAAAAESSAEPRPTERKVEAPAPAAAAESPKTGAVGVDAIKANGMTGGQISGKVDRKFSKGKNERDIRFGSTDPGLFGSTFEATGKAAPNRGGAARNN